MCNFLCQHKFSTHLGKYQVVQMLVEGASIPLHHGLHNSCVNIFVSKLQNILSHVWNLYLEYEQKKKKEEKSPE